MRPLPSGTRDLFLAQKIEVGVAAWSGVDNSGKVARKVVRVAATYKRKRKRKFEHDLRLADGLTIWPILAVDGDIAATGNGIKERFATGVEE